MRHRTNIIMIIFQCPFSSNLSTATIKTNNDDKDNNKNNNQDNTNDLKEEEQRQFLTKFPLRKSHLIQEFPASILSICRQFPESLLVLDQDSQKNAIHIWIVCQTIIICNQYNHIKIVVGFWNTHTFPIICQLPIDRHYTKPHKCIHINIFTYLVLQIVFSIFQRAFIHNCFH